MKTAEELLNLPTTEDIIKEVISNASNVDYKQLANQYNPSGHDVMDITKRPNKKIKTGNDKSNTKEVNVTRIALPLQKIIVERAVAFLFTNPVALKIATKGEEKIDDILLRMINYLLKKNKVSALNKEIARLLFKETEVAEYWYPVEDPTFWNKFDFTTKSKYRLRCRLFNPSAGDTLYPVFNEYNDLIAFGRGYEVLEDNEKIPHLDLFTDKRIIIYRKDSNIGWYVKEETENIIGKIPIIYYQQPQAEWTDVQTSINRLETLISNYSDTNDYFGAPLVKVKGKVTGFAEKGEQGKVITISEGGDAEYLTWNQAPTAIKLEIETLLNFIYSMTQTPDIAFKTVQGITNISGIALKLLFLDAMLKAENKKEVFDDTMTRRLSVLKAYCSKFNTTLGEKLTDVDIEAVITPFVPQNMKEAVELLYTANGGKQLISREKSIVLAGLVDDPSAELETIQKEESADQVRSIGESYN